MMVSINFTVITIQIIFTKLNIWKVVVYIYFSKYQVFFKAFYYMNSYWNFDLKVIQIDTSFIWLLYIINFI